MNYVYNMDYQYCKLRNGNNIEKYNIFFVISVG